MFVTNLMTEQILLVQKRDFVEVILCPEKNPFRILLNKKTSGASAKIKVKVLQCFERNSQNLGHTNMISLGQTSKGSARAARVPVSTSCLSWSRPVFEFQESEH